MVCLLVSLVISVIGWVVVGQICLCILRILWMFCMVVFRLLCFLLRVVSNRLLKVCFFSFFLCLKWCSSSWVSVGFLESVVQQLVRLLGVIMLSVLCSCFDELLLLVIVIIVVMLLLWVLRLVSRLDSLVLLFIVIICIFCESVLCLQSMFIVVLGVVLVLCSMVWLIMVIEYRVFVSVSVIIIILMVQSGNIFGLVNWLSYKIYLVVSGCSGLVQVKCKKVIVFMNVQMMKRKIQCLIFSFGFSYICVWWVWWMRGWVGLVWVELVWFGGVEWLGGGVGGVFMWVCYFCVCCGGLLVWF